RFHRPLAAPRISILRPPRRGRRKFYPLAPRARERDEAHPERAQRVDDVDVGRQELVGRRKARPERAARERQALERDVRVEHALQEHLLAVGVARREHRRPDVRDEERLREPPERRLVVARALGERRRAPREAEKDGRDGAARRQAEGPQVHLHIRRGRHVPQIHLRRVGRRVRRRLRRLARAGGVQPQQQQGGEGAAGPHRFFTDYEDCEQRLEVLPERKELQQ
ncbi:unnamed protein product, partial [Pelagomonas calceolata]